MTPLRISIFCAFLLLAFCAVGCLSPTIPLPPPDPDEVSVSSPDDFGLVTVKGKVLEEVYVSCLNERTDEGVITKSGPEGYFDLKIAAQVKDALTLWLTMGAEIGIPTTVVVPSEEESDQ